MFGLRQRRRLRGGEVEHGRRSRLQARRLLAHELALFAVERARHGDLARRLQRMEERRDELRLQLAVFEREMVLFRRETQQIQRECAKIRQSLRRVWWSCAACLALLLATLGGGLAWFGLSTRPSVGEELEWLGGVDEARGGCQTAKQSSALRGRRSDTNYDYDINKTTGTAGSLPFARAAGLQEPIGGRSRWEEIPAAGGCWWHTDVWNDTRRSTAGAEVDAASQLSISGASSPGVERGDSTTENGSPSRWRA